MDDGLLLEIYLDEDDELCIDLEVGKINNETKGVSITASPIPNLLLDILEDGGIIEHLRRKSGFQSRRE